MSEDLHYLMTPVEDVVVGDLLVVAEEEEVIYAGDRMAGRVSINCLHYVAHVRRSISSGIFRLECHRMLDRATGQLQEDLVSHYYAPGGKVAVLDLRSPEYGQDVMTS